MIAIISDIHSNIQALKAVLKEIDGVDEIWSLGDLVGYGPNPNEVIETLKNKLSISLAGNHDKGAIGKIDMSDFTMDAAQAISFTEKELSPENKRYLEELPTLKTNKRFTLAHGAPGKNEWEYILSYESALYNFDQYETAWCFVGHTHIPAVFSKKAPHILVPEEDKAIKLDPTDKLIINPGSVGQPRDGIAKSSYALLDEKKNEFVLKRVDYDISATQEAMEKRDLPKNLIERLGVGL